MRRNRTLFRLTFDKFGNDIKVRRMRIQDKEIVLNDDLELPSSRLKRSLTSEDSLISDFIEYLFGQRGRVDREKNCFSNVFEKAR